MTSRERLLAAIARRPTDRLPCAPNVGAGLVEALPPAEWEALRRDTDVTLTSGGGLDDVAIFGGRHVQGTRRTTRRGDETTVELETPRGPLRSRRVRTPQSSWQAEPLCKTPADVEALLSIPYEAPAVDVQPYHDWVERLGDDGLVSLGMPSAMRLGLAAYGPQALYLALADAPAQVERLIATMNERLVLYVEDCCRQGVRSFWMGGSEHCGPGVVHPRWFRRLVAPHDRRVVDVIHAHGGVVNYHTHGKLRDILPDIAGVGVDVMSPVETGLRGDVTLAQAKAAVGDRVCLKGNLDDMAFLALAGEAEVRAAAADCIEQAAAGGGYILSGTDAGVYSPQWVASFLILAEMAAQHR